MDRRRFVGSMMAGAGMVMTVAKQAAAQRPVTSAAERVTLGRSGVEASFVGLGTGVHGWNGSSNATRMGYVEFEKILRHGIDRGVTLIDVAELYGTHPYIQNILRAVPRERLTIQSKIWFARGGLPQPSRDATQAVDRFLGEMGVEYIDSVLLHCTTAGDWTTELRPMMDQLDALKAAGKVRAVGTSCHSRSALEANLAADWADIQLARINHRGEKMDGAPADIAALLRHMREAGKGVIGMKIYGEGAFRDAAEREASLRFVLAERCIDAMIIGFESTAHIDETLATIERLSAA